MRPSPQPMSKTLSPSLRSAVFNIFSTASIGVGTNGAPWMSAMSVGTTSKKSTTALTGLKVFGGTR